MAPSTLSNRSDIMYPASALTQAGPWKSPTAFLLYITVVSLLLPFVYGCSKGANTLVELPPPRVIVAHPLKQPFRQFLEQNGSVEAVQTAEVRSRAQGFIQKVGFEPGQVVTSGEMLPDGTSVPGTLLYWIEPDQYQAKYESAKSAEAAAAASVVVAEAEVLVASSDLEKATKYKDRLMQLRESQAVSAAEFDENLAAVQSAQANLSAAIAAVQLAKSQQAQAQATVAQAKLDLGYTEVRAPISGRISEPLIKLGNLVENGTLLANITDSREVFVNFSVNDRDALRFLQRQRQGGISDEQSRARWEEQAIYLSTEVDTGFPHVGVLDYVDQTGVDPTTGTLGLRARFPNPEGILLPGTFVRLRIVSAEATEAILLPETCVLQDSKRTYVLTLDRQNVVSETEIRVREKVDGWVIVSAGLDETTLVIVEGLQKAQQNKPVTPEKIDLKPTDFWLGETSQGGEKGANLTEPGTAAGRDF